jgi:hypothetical protein
MADPTAELAAIDKEYQDHFARRPRVTRSLGKLDELLTRLQPLLAAGGEGGERAAALNETWQKERTLIAELQAGGDLARQAHLANALSNLTGRRYLRHYAGKSRRTRDVSMLREILTGLERWNRQMTAIARQWDHPVFADARARHAEQITVCQRELEAIPSDSAWASPSERASAFATRANHQFRWYRIAFANKPRDSRRIQLLDRMVGELDEVHSGMQGLVREGYRDSSHLQNAEIVTRNLGVYRQELNQVRAAQAQNVAGLYGLLASEANGLFDRYRKDFAGQPRNTRDPEALAELCDTLLEVGLNMEDAQRARNDRSYENNLLVVLENLQMYENELERIVEARKPAVN